MTTQNLDDTARFSLMRQFLMLMFEPYGSDGYVELRAIGGKYPDRQFLALSDLFGDEEAVARIFRWADALNYSHGKAIYYGVLPRDKQSGTKDFISRAAYLWADIDFKKTGEEAGFAAAVKGEYEPEILVHSGHGLHAYYRLSTPFGFETKARREAFEALVGTLQQKILPGMDPVNDTPRVMRLPGFFNRKDPKDPRFVSVLKSPEIK